VGRYVVRRFWFTLVTLLAVTLVTFVLSHIVPADPVVLYLGEHASDQQITVMRHELGLDQPLPTQFLTYMRHLSSGDLGVSIHDNRPILDDLRTYLPATVELASAALLMAILIAIPAGVLSALHRNRILDHVARLVALAGVSIPVFFMAMLLLTVFYQKLSLLPGPGELGPYTPVPPRITGMTVLDAGFTADWPAVLDGLWHLILPALVLGLFITGLIMRITRSSMLEVLHQEYLRTARAKGLTETFVIVRHGLRNALVPVITILGLAYGNLLTGAVLTETIFSWPGIGRYATESVATLDIPAILGVVLVAAITYSLVNFVVDLVYGFLDPRIRFG